MTTDVFEEALLDAVVALPDSVDAYERVLDEYADHCRERAE